MQSEGPYTHTHIQVHEKYRNKGKGEEKQRASRSLLRQVYVGAPFSHFFAQVGSCWRSWALSWLILSLLGPILSPSCSKMAPRWPNIAPRWPNIAQHSAKMSQHSLQEPSQDPPKPIKSDELSSFFGFSLVLARSPPRSKKSHQDPPKSARKLPILGSKCAILATFWR